MSIDDPTEEQLRALWDYVTQWRDQFELCGPEPLVQSDRVNEILPLFVEGLLERIGYHEYEYYEDLFRRASGDVICTVCGKPYRKHPVARDHPGYDGEPFLNRLCDGSLVKP